MRQGSRWVALPIGVIGLAITVFFGTLAATLLVLVLGYGCGGSDVSAPSENFLCNTAAETPIGIAMAVLAIGGPLYGTIAATHHRSPGPLVLGTLVGLLGMLGFLAAFSF
jgi:hypothetical protein